MKKIKEFNKSNLKDFRNELDALLKKYEAKSGVELKSKGIKYGSNTITVSVEGKIVGSQSTVAKALELFTKFKENDIIRIAQLGEVKVVGYKQRNRKYPYLVQTMDGKQYKLSDTQVENRMEIV
jgi:hypothetical protein